MCARLVCNIGTYAKVQVNRSKKWRSNRQKASKMFIWENVQIRFLTKLCNTERRN